MSEPLMSDDECPGAVAPVDVVGAHGAWREVSPNDPAGTIVLLHGLGGSRVSWEPQLHGLGTRYRVVAWDLPGYGAAPALAVPMTFASLADAVRELIDELGDEQVHLVGISFGGMIAQCTAALYPQRIASLVLLASSPRFGLDGTRPDEWRAARLAALDSGAEPGDFAEAVLTSLAGPHITPRALAGQVAAMRRVSSVALRRSIDCLVTHDARALLPSIAAPTLCLVGELDTETPPAYAVELADLIPRARLCVIEGAGHLLNVEAADTVNRAIADHIDAAVRV